MNKTSNKPYLPKDRCNYHPTTDSIENEVEQKEAINLPNPANDPIVVNNIAWQEFDYTEDLTDEVIPSPENNTHASSRLDKKLF